MYITKVLWNKNKQKKNNTKNKNLMPEFPFQPTYTYNNKYIYQNKFIIQKMAVKFNFKNSKQNTPKTKHITKI